jgi:hypothetical protein
MYHPYLQLPAAPETEHLCKHRRVRSFLRAARAAPAVFWSVIPQTGVCFRGGLVQAHLPRGPAEATASRIAATLKRVSGSGDSHVRFAPEASMPIGSTLSETQLRWMAVARITDGRLPVILAPILRPRHGFDELCRVCERRIDQYRFKYQVTDARDGNHLSFHLICYRHWQLECRRLLAQRDGGTNGCGDSAKPTTRRSSRPW